MSGDEEELSTSDFTDNESACSSEWSEDSNIMSSVAEHTDMFNVADYFTEDKFTSNMIDELTQLYRMYFHENLQERSNSKDSYIQCTYPRGYMKRQDIYTCLDCNKTYKQPNALCFSCAMICHPNHNVIDLYSKRNFRCDCGNNTFGENRCKLYPNKEEYNLDNVYNDNFRGIYCICKQPYDANDKDKDSVMIQCIICEDWYHTTHLDEEPIVDSEGKYTYDEFICFICVNKYSYLSKYTHMLGDVRETNKFNAPPLRAVEFNVEYCRLRDLPPKLPYSSHFLPAEWRNHLCRCKKCLKIYRANNHMFLLDNEDILINETDNEEFVEYVSDRAPNNVKDNPITIDPKAPLPNLTSEFAKHYLQNNPIEARNPPKVVTKSSSKVTDKNPTQVQVIDKTTADVVTAKNTDVTTTTTDDGNVPTITDNSEFNRSANNQNEVSFLVGVVNEKKHAKLHSPTNESDFQKKRSKYDENEDL